MQEEAVALTHGERLRLELDGTRKILIQTAGSLTPDELDWSPNPKASMKSFKQVLQEIGTMEAVTLHMAAYREALDWGAVWASLAKSDTESLLGAMNDVRDKTLAYLNRSDDAALATLIPLSPEWQGYLGAPVVEAAVLLQ